MTCACFPFEQLIFRVKSQIRFFRLGECLKISGAKTRIQSSPPIATKTQHNQTNTYIYDHCKGDYKITLVPIKSGRNLNLTMLSDGKIWCGPGIPRIEYSGPRKTG